MNQSKQPQTSEILEKISNEKDKQIFDKPKIITEVEVMGIEDDDNS